MMKDSRGETMSNVQEERRQAQRHVAWVPAYLSPASDGVERLCVTHDMSTTGGLLMTHARLTPGEPVTVELFIGPDLEHPKIRSAHVVRSELRTGKNTFWTFNTALNFDEPIDDAQADIEELERKQGAWYNQD